MFSTYLKDACTTTATIFLICYCHLLARKIVVKISFFAENKMQVMKAMFSW